jgi:hypothetical protein
MEDIVKCLAEHVKLNSPETMELYDEINEMREYHVNHESNQFRKIIAEVFNQFAFGNGLIKRVLQDETLRQYLTDEQKTCLALWTGGALKYQPKCRYRQAILNYYFKNMGKKMSELSMADAGFKPHDYYSAYPAIVKGIEKKKIEFPEIKVGNSPITPQERAIYIKIGKSIQFDVEGFYMNEMLYLLYGMCITDVASRKFNSFSDIINHILGYCQLNLLNKVFRDMVGDGESGKYNLITYVRFDDGQENFRYLPAEKYEKNLKNEGNTKYVIEGKKKYIYTEYTKEQYNKFWEDLEEEWKKNDLSDKLITMWFDSQCLTRSTCLVGVLLICIREYKKNKLVRFKKDEMPDWKAIMTGNFDDTYSVEEISSKGVYLKEREFTLSDVLSVLRDYLLN